MTADEELKALRREGARPCTMGVGCDEVGICYAESHGQPDRCPREALSGAVVNGTDLAALAEAVRNGYTPSSATILDLIQRAPEPLPENEVGDREALAAPAAVGQADDAQDLNRALVDLLRHHGVKPTVAIAIRDDLLANGLTVAHAMKESAHE